MPLDTRAAYADIMGNADALLAKTASRLAKSPLSKVAEQTATPERLTAIDEAVAATQADAQGALAKLASVNSTKLAKRAEKVAIVRHMARIANRLLEA